MKTVIISGGSSGIGLATAQRFYEEGYFTYLLDIQPPKNALKNAQFISCDVTNLADIENAIKIISKDSLAVDALICCAGIHLSATILDTTEADYQRVMDINFKGTFFLTKAVLPLMLAHKKGAIVFVGSDQTTIAKPHSAIYGASKTALASLAKTTALDYALDGIRANVVAVGTINTPLYQKAIMKYCEKTGEDIHQVHRAENAAQPMGRIGEPEEVANLIYFLAEDKASFITGGIYAIDGGYTVR